MVHCNIACWYGGLYNCRLQMFSFTPHAAVNNKKKIFVWIIFFLVFQNTSPVAFAWKVCHLKINEQLFAWKSLSTMANWYKVWSWWKLRKVMKVDNVMKTFESDESWQLDEKFGRWWKWTTWWKVRKVIKVNNLMSEHELFKKFRLNSKTAVNEKKEKHEKRNLLKI